MNVRCLAAWSGATLLAPLVSTNPAYRLAVVLVALDVVVTTSRRALPLKPLVIALCASGALAVVVEIVLSHDGAHTLVPIPDWVPVIGGTITLEALLFGLDVALGIAAAVLAVAPLARAADPHQLVDALPAALHRTAVAAGSALAMVPGVTRSAVAIHDAQRMRGIRGRGPRVLCDLLVPVAVTAMEDSVTLAEAMEARGYGSGPRTRAAAAAPSRADLAVLATAALSAVLTVVARVAGWNPDWYTAPSAALPAVHAVPILACALLLTPALVWRPPAFAD